MKLSILTTVATLTATTAFAAGSDDHSHGHGHSEGGPMEMMASGMPGMMDDVSRTIDVVMRETDDGEMIFEPTEFNIKQGETIRFHVTNKGVLEHEFVIDTKQGNARHKEMMAAMDMEHDDPNSVRLDADESGEVVWNFANKGAFEFACLIPGHYEAGMHGPIDVMHADIVLAQADAERTYTRGVVKKIKADKGKVTIIHEELIELDMPAMTMVFRADDKIIGQLSEGEDIEFAAERIKGKLTVTDVK